jgi:serine/threonine protein kinase
MQVETIGQRVEKEIIWDQASARFGGWNPVGLLAQGRVFQLMLARPSSQSEEVPIAHVLKVPRPDQAHEHLPQLLLKREAEVARSVVDPRIVSILDSHLEVPPFFLVLPLLEGQSLKNILVSRRPTVLQALWIARQVVQGLAALEKAGWNHGDLKPSNIHVNPRGHVTLLDLGFARRRHEHGWKEEHLLMGTPIYMAPELFTSSNGGDIRSDLYSLGVILFEMVAGRPPILGTSLQELYSRKLTEPPPRLNRFCPEVPPQLDRLVRKLLSRNPLRRPQSAHEVAERIVDLEISLIGRRFGADSRRCSGPDKSDERGPLTMPVGSST